VLRKQSAVFKWLVSYGLKPAKDAETLAKYDKLARLKITNECYFKSLSIKNFKNYMRNAP